MGYIDTAITAAATEHQLPVALVKAIVQVESSGDPFAARYESGFYRRYVRAKDFAVFRGCSRETEGRLRATSFGLMQVMGQTAREMGFKGTFLTELCSPDVGLNIGCQYLRKQIDRYDGNLEAAVAAYNAGTAIRTSRGKWRNQLYVDRIHVAGGFE